MNPKTIVCFGEILWDLFPEGKRLGGAPFNVANSLRNLGVEVQFISSIGNDSLGEEILAEVRIQGMSTDYIQRDPNHKTGTVHVNLDDKGSAQYKISKDAAWDFILAHPTTIELVANSSAFVFGSLIARGFSFKALNRFLDVAQFRVFDLNLRPPFYSQGLLNDLMQKAELLKFNDEELYQIAAALDSPFHTMDQHIEFIAKQTQTEIICVTKGKYGAVLYYKGDWFYNSGYKIEVQDTVGAGDSFLAILTYGLIEKKSIQDTLNRACAMGALVAGSTGANPKISESDLIAFIDNTKLH